MENKKEHVAIDKELKDKKLKEQNVKEDKKTNKYIFQD